MSFRDTEFDESSVNEQVSSLSRRTSRVGLPEGFEWVVTVNSNGETTIAIRHIDSNRIVLEGF